MLFCTILSSNAQFALGHKLINSLPFSPLFFSQNQGLSWITEKDKGADPEGKSTEMSMASQVGCSKNGMLQVQHFSCILHFSIKQKGKKTPKPQSKEITTFPQYQLFHKFWAFLTLILQATEKPKRREYRDCHSINRSEKVPQRLRDSEANFINKRRKTQKTALKQTHTMKRKKNKNPVMLPKPVGYKNRTNLLLPSC